MSERQRSAFYGGGGRPTVFEVMAALFLMTGSEVCAKELLDAANYVEMVAPGRALIRMNEWWN